VSSLGNLYLEFWDEAGNRVLAPFEWRPGDKDVWIEIVVVAEAPSNAKYALHAIKRSVGNQQISAT